MMSDYIFSDSKNVEKIKQSASINPSDLYKVMYKLALYNHFVNKWDKQKSYDDINSFLKKKCSDYIEVRDYKVLDRCIKGAPKRQWTEIDKVIITHEELAVISALNNDKQEKIAFVLLADAKYNIACGKYDFGVSFLSVNKLFVLSRVVVPRVERNLFLSFLYDNDLVKRNTNPSFKGMLLNYMSDSNDNVGIELSENNYKELAFTYMNWKYGGYKECVGCGRLIKIKKNTQHCKDCAKKNIPIESKIITCIDCGKEIHVSSKHNNGCRCEDCKNTHRQNYMKEFMRKKRESEQCVSKSNFV